MPDGPVVIGPPATNQALVMRIDNPDDTDANLDALLPASPGRSRRRRPAAAIGSATPALAGAAPADARDGKLAIFPAAAGVRRSASCSSPSPTSTAASTASSARQCPHGRRTTRRHAHADHAVMNGERQGEYNMAFAVSPPTRTTWRSGWSSCTSTATAAGPPAAADWLRAQMWDLYHVERGHHADHHALVFAPVPAAPFENGATAGTLALWDANDGGISWCPNWPTAGATFPIGTGDHRWPTPSCPCRPTRSAWRKRSHGISAAQMYDLTQHPRLPTVHGLAASRTTVCTSAPAGRRGSWC